MCRGFGNHPPALTAVDSIPVALLSAAKCMTPEHWIATCDSALNTVGLTVPEMASELRTSSRKVASLLDKCDPRSQSGTESITRIRLRSAGFAVVVQPQIPGVGRADLRIGRLILECDSITHHTSLDNYQNDRRRDRRALVDGWLCASPTTMCSTAGTGCSPTSGRSPVLTATVAAAHPENCRGTRRRGQCALGTPEYDSFEGTTD